MQSGTSPMLSGLYCFFRSGVGAIGAGAGALSSWVSCRCDGSLHLGWGLGTWLGSEGLGLCFCAGFTFSPDVRALASTWVGAGGIGAILLR